LSEGKGKRGKLTFNKLTKLKGFEVGKGTKKKIGQGLVAYPRMTNETEGQGSKPRVEKPKSHSLSPQPGKKKEFAKKEKPVIVQNGKLGNQKKTISPRLCIGLKRARVCKWEKKRGKKFADISAKTLKSKDAEVSPQKVRAEKKETQTA